MQWETTVSIRGTSKDGVENTNKSQQDKLNETARNVKKKVNMDVKAVPASCYAGIFSSPHGVPNRKTNIDIYTAVKSSSLCSGHIFRHEEDTLKVRH